MSGFKWIGSRAEELNREEGYFALFGYEEAIGFSCGNVVFDKDGISAMGVFTELAYHVYHKGLTLAKHMQSLYDKYGEFVSNNGKNCEKRLLCESRRLRLMSSLGNLLIRLLHPERP